MRKYTLLLMALFLLSFPVSGAALTLDASTIPTYQGENHLYACAYDVPGDGLGNDGTYRNLTYGGSQIWYTPENTGNDFFLNTRPWIRPGQTIGDTNYSTYIRMDPSAEYQCANVLPPEDPVLAWDVQTNGIYNLQGEFVLATQSGSNSDGINYYIKINDTIKVSGYLSKGQTASFDETVALASTDWLYFGVNAYGNDYCDWGHFQGSVDVVPLPGPVWLLGSGLLGLAGWRRFRKS